MTVSLYILRSERIKKLIAMKQFPDILLHTSYHASPATEQRAVDNATPCMHWFEADGGSDCNFNHFQNFCVHLAFFILSKVDKLVMYQSDAMHLYLNTVERLMVIVNIELANHATCLDPDTSLFLLDTICDTNSMKQVQDVIAKYEVVRKDAIKFVMRVCSHEQPPTDGSVASNDEDGGTETSVANNDKDGGSKPNNNVEKRSGDEDSRT
eukprot:13332562-Ditylum_brightwellii.AAC.1